jgi:hypothetical protein
VCGGGGRVAWLGPWGPLQDMALAVTAEGYVYVCVWGGCITDMTGDSNQPPLTT